MKYERLSDERLTQLRNDWRDGHPIHSDDIDALLREVEYRRAADRERETRQYAHGTDCWKWHHECAVARLERARGYIAARVELSQRVEFDRGWVSCAKQLLEHFDAAMRGE